MALRIGFGFFFLAFVCFYLALEFDWEIVRQIGFFATIICAILFVVEFGNRIIQSRFGKSD